MHTVCAKVTDEFLEWCKEAGNDLITPHPEYGFPGLKSGDSWCVCASWYARAVEADKGCNIYLKKTHENTIKILPIEVLKKFSGLHNFMNWQKPILTDSGGNQIMSLSKFNKIDIEMGSIFNSHLDGKKIILSPEKSIQVQKL